MRDFFAYDKNYYFQNIFFNKADSDSDPTPQKKSSEFDFAKEMRIEKIGINHR